MKTIFCQTRRIVKFAHHVRNVFGGETLADESRFHFDLQNGKDMVNVICGVVVNLFCVNIRDRIEIHWFEIKNIDQFEICFQIYKTKKCTTGFFGLGVCSLNGGGAILRAAWVVWTPKMTSST